MALVIVAPMLADGVGTAAAQEIDLHGVVGIGREWSLQIQLTRREPERDAFGGGLILRHIGICEANGHSTKTGTASTSLRGGSLYGLVLRFEDQECTLTGPLRIRPTSTQDVLRCNKGLQVPVTLWSEPQGSR